MTIEVSNLSIIKSGKALISDISFRAEPGELIGIIGENGAGKSTLLNALSGLEASHNAISLNQEFIENYSVEDLAKYRAVLPQNNELVFPFEAKEVVRLGLSLTSLSLQQQYSIVEQCLEDVDAQSFSQKSYLFLSGGERQRIQLARVLAQICASNQQQRYLLLDEPTSALDLKHKYSIFSQLKRLTEKGIGVLAIIHDLNLASMYCDKILMLSQGRLVGFDSPAHILKEDSIKKHFDADVLILDHPQTESPLVVSQLDIERNL